MPMMTHLYVVRHRTEHVEGAGVGKMVYVRCTESETRYDRDLFRNPHL